MSTPANPGPVIPREHLDEAIESVRAAGEKQLAARGEKPTAAHYVMWHDNLDIDPDLYGRDYTGGAA